MTTPIKGYRTLTEAEIEAINTLKEAGAILETLISAMRLRDADQRWVSIGATHLQQGMMALVRAVARPEGF